MTQIMTVLGPINLEEVGTTSMHEHILIDIRPFIKPLTPKALLDDVQEIMDEPISLENFDQMRRQDATNTNMVLDDEEVMTAEVAEFKEFGGSTMVDVTPLGLRLDPEAIRRISEKTRVNIVTSTGIFWAEHISEPVPRGQELKEFMLKELNEGIDNTGIRAGHIKIGISELTEQTVADFEAVAHVVAETGVAVSVHPGFNVGNDGLAIAGLLSAHGMLMDRLIVSHCDIFLDGVSRSQPILNNFILQPERWGLKLDYHRRLLDQGVTLSFDTFGFSVMNDFRCDPPDWKRLAGLVALIREGYSSQIVLGVDIGTKTQVRRYGGHGYTHLTNFVIPKLKEVGVSDYAIQQITVDNPGRLLTAPHY